MGEIQTLPDGTKYLVNPSKIRGGGPPKDGIPSIDKPKFISVSEADSWISDNELVLVYENKGIKRVYPFQILVWHEIVNDNVSGKPVLITYCPLCGSGVVYDRVIQGEEIEFGTSGKLYNSNLVMYDRKTDTYWSQIGGRAIVGPLTGMELKLLDSNVVSWGDYKTKNPEAEVLSKDTGFAKSYGHDPYGNYYTDRNLFFPVDSQETRSGIHPKSIVFGVEFNGIFKAYREEDIINAGFIEDKVNGINVKAERFEDGTITITNLDTQEIIPKERDMWFAWFAFHPETKIYGYDENFKRII